MISVSGMAPAMSGHQNNVSSAPQKDGKLYSLGPDGSILSGILSHCVT